MLGTVALSHRPLAEYEDVAGSEAIAELRALAAPLRGLRLVNLSLTAFGTWTTDLLGSTVPLLQDLGIDASWYVLRSEHEFEREVRALYAALNGAGPWTPDVRRVWERFSARTREALGEAFDVVVVHDPQLVGIAPDRMFSSTQTGSGQRWIWHSHLDLSAADPAAWRDLRGYAERYDAVIFEDRAFVPREPPLPHEIVPPGIDPLGPRNVRLDRENAALLAGELGIDAGHPLITQVSPLDEGSDLHGLIEVFDALHPRFPTLQLAIVPTAVRDDEETRAYFERVARLVKERPNCRMLPLPGQAGNAEVNAVEQVSAVVVQKSLRRGFAPWLSESMWKERPIVAGRTAGTLAQVEDGVTGFLVPDTATCVERVAMLLSDQVFAARMGTAGRRRVQERFLVTHYLADTLRLLGRVVSATKTP